MLSCKRKYKRIISVLIIFIIVISSMIPTKIARAAEPWVIIDDSYNNSNQKTEVKEDTIVQTGTHNNAEYNAIRYRTLYYRMVRDTYDRDQKFTVGKNAQIEYKYVPFKFGKTKVNGDIKTVEYIIQQKDFMNAASDLGITGDYIVEHGSATVYLNNVFQIFQGDNILHSSVYGYQEMLKAEDGWSAATVNYLKGYYNFKYVISNSTVFNVKVIAVDEDDNILNSDLLGHKKHAIYNEEIPPYTLSDDTIKKGGFTYDYQHWKYTYKDRESEKTKTLGNYSGKKVSFNAPDAYPDSTLTVKMVFKKQTADYYYRIEAVDKNHKKIGDMISENNKKSTKYNSTVTYDIANKMTFNRVKYAYQNQWYLTYMDPSGTSVMGTTKDGDISEKMPNAKENSVAVFHVVYGETPITPTPTPKITATPTPKPSSTPFPTVTPIPIPEAADPISLPLDSPDPYGVINGDSYSSPYFLSKQGISTTESQYVYVKTKDYLLGYTLVNRTGKITYSVPITMVYTLNYYSATPDKYGGKKKVTTVEKNTQIISVERAYSYWEIENLEYYAVNSAKVYNYSLPCKEITLHTNNSYANIPSLVSSHSSNVSDHVSAPSQVSSGITLSKTISSDASLRPDIDYEDLTWYAQTMTDEATVSNDYLLFDGKAVLSKSGFEKIASSPNTSSFQHCNTITKDKALFTEGKVIATEKENGNYSSTGSVSYSLDNNSVHATSSSKTYKVDVNNVIIHTPVICDPVIKADNDKWTQLLNPEKGAIQLVIDPDSNLNDFTVKISNTLEHSARLGYYTRDFSRSFIDPENISYIAKKGGLVRNEMKLPFDVYVDILDDNKMGNDQFIKAGTWIIMGRATGRFYVPMWVSEGTYTAEFRTIAVNGTDKLTKTEETRNSTISNYVAVATQKFEISGRIYGLTLYDISDYPNWENVFRVEDTMLFKLFEGKTDGTQSVVFNKNSAYYYTVGVRNQYGNTTGRFEKYTFPLINGSHPKYENLGALKTGYAVRFLLDTTGEMYGSGCKIKITPTFYYVDANGKNRRRADLYYNEEIKDKVSDVAKVGAGIDLVNIQSGYTGNIYSRIPEREIKQTAAVLGTTYSKIANQQSTMYSYSDIRLLPAFRTFTGTDYAARITDLASYSNVKEAIGQTKTNLLKYIQRWYGTYKLPTNLHAAPAGYDVYGYLKKYGIDYQEKFWLTGGYIIVNFDIITIDKNGKKHLSYINADNYLNNGNCSMWVTEGGVLQKTDDKAHTFHFKAGDFIIYYTDKKSSDDYSGGLY